MMKVKFLNANALIEAIDLVADDLGIERVNDGEELTVTVNSLSETKLEVEILGKAVTVSYGGGVAVFLRGLAMASAFARDGITEKSVSETPVFDLNGAMVDMSRNAVMNVSTVKLMLRKMALMGLNAFMLYTEDTYEIDGYPYFGYMRGRYTKDELRELDAYAKTLGIELIPCTQTLGHLLVHLKWGAATPYKDSIRTLLVGADETYKLIDSMLKTITECFSTKRVHIGMDETQDLGTGRYLSLNGYRPKGEIYLEHLNRVVDMVKGYGLKPMMWSDMMMLFTAVGDTAGKHGYNISLEHTEEVKKIIPEGLEQVFWDYYNSSESFYEINVRNHRKYLGDCTLFAGGIWTWSGYAPLFKRSLDFTIPALNVCKREGVREIIATIWHNGAECNLITSLAGLAWYADYGYKGYYDEDSMKACFRFATGESYDSFAALEEVEEPHGMTTPLSRPLLYNDPLLPLADKNLEGVEYHDYYKSLTPRLSALQSSDIYAPAFDTIRKLSSVLEEKSDFGMRLKRAYDLSDRDTLSKMAEECDVIVEKLDALRLAHKNAWMTYNKPFGWEVLDLRYGGLIVRFRTAKDRITSYLSGEEESLPELEVERLRVDCSDNPDTALSGHMLWRQYSSYATVGLL